MRRMFVTIAVGAALLAIAFGRPGSAPVASSSGPAISVTAGSTSGTGYGSGQGGSEWG